MGEHEDRSMKDGVVAPPPFHSSSSHGPRCGPNLLRPMISAPMPGPQLLAKASSTPVSPPALSCIAWKVRVAKSHSISRSVACPKGASRLCPSPVPNPSRETEKLCTRTCSIARPPQNYTHNLYPHQNALSSLQFARLKQ